MNYFLFLDSQCCMLQWIINGPYWSVIILRNLFVPATASPQQWAWKSQTIKLNMWSFNQMFAFFVSLKREMIGIISSAKQSQSLKTQEIKRSLMNNWWNVQNTDHDHVTSWCWFLKQWNNGRDNFPFLVTLLTWHFYHTNCFSS